MSNVIHESTRFYRLESRDSRHLTHATNLIDWREGSAEADGHGHWEQRNRGRAAHLRLRKHAPHSALPPSLPPSLGTPNMSESAHLMVEGEERDPKGIPFQGSFLKPDQNFGDGRDCWSCTFILIRTVLKGSKITIIPVLDTAIIRYCDT